MSRTFGTRLPGLIGFAGILATFLFVITPLTIYLGNIDEFVLAFETLGAHCLKPAVVLVGTLVAIGCLLPESIFDRYVGSIAALCILVWIQGHLFVWDYGQLDGSSIDWMKGRWRGAVDGATWTLVAASALFLPRKGLQLLSRFAVAVFFVQTAFIAVASYEHAEALGSKPARVASRDGEPEMYRFSPEKNVLHIIADGFQSDVFEEIIASPDEGARIRKSLEGFTFFREHAGAFPLTHMSVPAIFSGQIYKNHSPRSDFLDAAMGGDSILNLAYDNGYDVDMVVPVGGITPIYMRSSHTNAYLISRHHQIDQVDHETDEFARLMDLTLFRISPHPLKRTVYNDQRWRIQPFLANTENRGQTFFSHLAFLEDMASKMSLDRPRPVYKMIHLMLSHKPMVSTGECDYAGEVLKMTRANVYNQARCALIGVLELFERMKELGIYDETTIVLMSDHGAGVTPKGMRTGPSKRGEPPIKLSPKRVSMALPLMAIKPAGKPGPFEISSAPTTIAETPITIATLMGLDSNFDGTPFFELDPDATRTRRHYAYKYRRSEWEADYLAPIQEFLITGSLFDTSSWQHGARYSRKNSAEGR